MGVTCTAQRMQAQHTGLVVACATSVRVGRHVQHGMQAVPRAAMVHVNAACRREAAQSQERDAETVRKDLERLEMIRKKR